MKGISAIISIILLVMISVSLAGMAWLWFYGITNTLSQSATSATETATTKMGMQGRIEVARFYPNTWVNTTIRNTGTVDIDLSKLGIFIDGIQSTTYAPNTGTISPGATATINVTNTTAACTDKTLKITFPNNLEDYITISC